MPFCGKAHHVLPMAHVTWQHGVWWKLWQMFLHLDSTVSAASIVPCFNWEHGSTDQEFSKLPPGDPKNKNSETQNDQTSVAPHLHVIFTSRSITLIYSNAWIILDLPAPRSSGTVGAGEGWWSPRHRSALWSPPPLTGCPTWLELGSHGDCWSNTFWWTNVN